MFTIRSEPADTVKTFAALRIVGDQLIPEQVTRILKIAPTRAYAKGQSYYGGERTGQLVGKTGVWYFATHRTVASDSLVDHLMFVVNLLHGYTPETKPLTRLHNLVKKQSLTAIVSCFWYGRAGARQPAIPRAVTEFLKLLPADIETDFDTDEEPEMRRLA
jgi:hypothetical protein